MFNSIVNKMAPEERARMVNFGRSVEMCFNASSVRKYVSGAVNLGPVDLCNAQMYYLVTCAVVDSLGHYSRRIVKGEAELIGEVSTRVEVALERFSPCCFEIRDALTQVEEVIECAIVYLENLGFIEETIDGQGYVLTTEGWENFCQRSIPLGKLFESRQELSIAS